ncbi:MAG TPA: helix-turn-helix domain-containing protein [Phycisphaerae bacterium]|nr:helix-turn-helix domain-containing protein [Phycisphaerae bacterium]
MSEAIAIPQKVLLTTAEAAQVLDLRKETLDAWRQQKRGPKYVKVGSNVRYRRTDIDAYIERNVVKTGS